MPLVSGIISFVVALCGLAAFVAGLGLAAAPNLAADRVDALSLRSSDALEDTTAGALRLGGVVGAALSAVAVAGETLDRTADLTEQAARTLKSTEKAGHHLSEGLERLCAVVSNLVEPGELKNATDLVRVGMLDAQRAFDDAATLSKQMPPLANDLRTLAREMDHTGAELLPVTEILPRIRDRLMRAHAALDPGSLRDAVRWGLRGFGGLLALLGLALVSVASARIRLEQVLRTLEE